MALYLQYVRKKDMGEVMKHLKDTWKMEPNAVISVTGRANKISMDPRVKEMLSRLVDVTQNTGNHTS